ncbi:hypothetical protein EDD37DRAFT_621422 [Exophiala viscosa]|uniref:Spo12 family protein n=1 Tax=Exophiala viscosa TaxID=2486360 RepID=A0AAN6E7C8_9EURO|nr:hypothetical protein EDD36DRAFT_425409 [Exophiala viscosa]KAI1627119.1 hypothetical protein EDD37DRAFT_621422 [Exophiala viscosa]
MSPTKSSTTTSALTERSPNTGSPTKPQSPKKMGLSIEEKEMPRFSHTAQKYAVGEAQNQTYISPSDAIASPTTKKLSEIKGKRFMSAKPQRTLFAKTLADKSLKMQQQPK